MPAKLNNQPFYIVTTQMGFVTRNNDRDLVNPLKLHRICAKTPRKGL